MYHHLHSFAWAEFVAQESQFPPARVLELRQIKHWKVDELQRDASTPLGPHMSLSRVGASVDTVTVVSCFHRMSLFLK